MMMILTTTTTFTTTRKKVCCLWLNTLVSTPTLARRNTRRPIPFGILHKNTCFVTECWKPKFGFFRRLLVSLLSLFFGPAVIQGYRHNLTRHRRRRQQQWKQQEMRFSRQVNRIKNVLLIESFLFSKTGFSQVHSSPSLMEMHCKSLLLHVGTTVGL